MADFIVDYKEIVKYGMDVQKAREKSAEKYTKAFLRKEGSMALRATKAAAKSSGINVRHRKSGKYAKSKHYIQTIKRGKPYRYQGAHAIRVYSYAPHAHLLEYGHKLVGHDPGKRLLGGSARAFKVFEKARRSTEAQFVRDCISYWEGTYGGLK